MKNLSCSNRQSGQTLVEVLIAIALSAILLPALATSMVAARDGRAQEGQRLQASALLHEAQEAVRSVREKGWNQLPANGTYHPAISGSAWTLTNLPAPTETIGNFTRQVVISDTQRDTSGAIVANGGSVDPSTKKVVVSVSWTAPTGAALSTTTYLQRHLGNAAWTQTTQAEFAAGTHSNTVATATGGGQVQLALTGGPAFVQNASSFDDASTTTMSQSFSANVKGGSLIVASATWDSAATTITCSDNQGNTYTTATAARDATSGQGLAICYAPNVSGGPTTVTATFSVASGSKRMTVSEYSGIATSSPVDVTSSNIANGNTTTDGITSNAAITTTSGDLIFGSLMEAGSGSTSITAGTGFTQRSLTNADFAAQDRVQAAAGSVASTQTFNSAQRYLAQMVAFKPAGAATAWSPPNIASSIDTPGTEDALDVQVVGNYAYVADATILRIYDVTNVASPTALGIFTAGGTINSLFVAGNFVYMATSNTAGELTIVNATNKSSLVAAATVNLPNTNVGTAVYVANNRAYIGRALSTTSGQNEFYIYDITTPTAPVAQGSLNLTAQVNSIYVPNATHAYLATSVTTAEVTVVKIDVPATPTSAGTYDASGTSVGNDIFVVGNTVYLAKANNTSGAELFILTANTAIPTAVTFTLAGSYEAGANINGVAVAGSNVFLATAITNAQFRVLDATTPSSLTVLGSLNLAAVSNKIAVAANYAYVASAHDTREVVIIQPSPATGSAYPASGTFESSTFDAAASAAYNYVTLTSNEPAGTNVRFQLATNNDNATWNYVGPDGTSATFYTSPAAIFMGTTGRYIRYKAVLTGPGTTTPSLSDISINYSP